VLDTSFATSERTLSFVWRIVQSKGRSHPSGWIQYNHAFWFRPAGSHRHHRVSGASLRKDKWTVTSYTA